MNSRSSSWTQRAPRTLAESFGPYTSHQLEPMPEPRNRHAQDWCIYACAVVALVAILILKS